MWPGGYIYIYILAARIYYPQLSVIYYPLSTHVSVDPVIKNRSLEQSFTKKKKSRVG